MARTRLAVRASLSLHTDWVQRASAHKPGGIWPACKSCVHDRMTLTLDEAATLVAQCWRNRAKRRLLRMIPDVATLKDHFLDPDAKAAGAEGSVLYTSGALKARELLRHAPPVKAALSQAWAALVPEGQTSMARAEYFVMLRKESGACDSSSFTPSIPPLAVHPCNFELSCLFVLPFNQAPHLTNCASLASSSQVFLFALIDSSEADLDAEDCISAAFKDWQVDSGGREALSQEAFDNSWFQMADLNVNAWPTAIELERDLPCMSFPTLLYDDGCACVRHVFACRRRKLMRARMLDGSSTLLLGSQSPLRRGLPCSASGAPIAPWSQNSLPRACALAPPTEAPSTSSSRRGRLHMPSS